jgi:TolB protein
LRADPDELTYLQRARVRSSAMASFGARPLIWFDRSGREVGKVGDPDPGNRPSLAPDGRQVAIFRSVDPVSPPDIWLIALDRDVLTRVTFNGAINLDPIWSPDGREVAFSVDRNNQFDLYRQRLDGTGKEELLLATPGAEVASDWSRDGRILLYTTLSDSKATADIFALPLNDEPPEKRKP